MDKAILKKFAIESRQDLMQRIENKIKIFYIDEEFSKQQNGDVYILANSKYSLNLSKEEYNKRELLIKRINELGLDQVIEEAAYTWFNRIVAIRYMEIHDYLPLTRDNQSLGIRVLSSKDNTSDPEIMKFTNLVNPELDIGFEKERYVELKDDNEKFKYILLLVCKKLGRVIPQVFDGVTDYIDILIPDNLLNESGFVNKIITEVPEENYEHVEIIGWLYQYYNQTEKDRVFSSKNKFGKFEIPYVTQLFTPDWIVHFLIDNSIGRIAINSFENMDIDLKYYYPSDNDNFKKIDLSDPENLTIIDPCCGSGHILVYAFEVLYKIYKRLGYQKEIIAEKILKNNIFGMDIDDRAGQLSVLSILLKAREYDKNIFSKINVNDLKIISIQETNNCEYIREQITDENAKLEFDILYSTFYNAKEYGSLIKIDNQKDFSNLKNYIDNDNTIFGYEIKNKVMPLLKQYRIFSDKYMVMATNPPYMNNNVMTDTMKKFLNNKYPNSKTDLCTAFMENNFVAYKGYLGMINQHSWMFLSSFENLRNNIINGENNIELMVHLGTRAFEEIGGEVVQTTSWIMRKTEERNKSIFIKLNDLPDPKLKEKVYLEEINKKTDRTYNVDCKKLINIPGMPIAYWISLPLLKVFEQSERLIKNLDSKTGMTTGDNDRFLRNWYEICSNKFYALNNYDEWYPYNKGGGYRKWYGNLLNVIDWQNSGKSIKNFKKSTIRNEQYYFRKCITWNLITTTNISVRFLEYPSVMGDAGPACYCENEEKLKYTLGLLNSVVANKLLNIINPTMNYSCGVMESFPFKYRKSEQILKLVDKSIELSKEDWNSFEISWSFMVHPLIEYKEGSNYGKDLDNWNYNIKDAYESWKLNCDEKFKLLKNNEEELNRIFIDIYELSDELTPEVDEKDITIRKADRLREIKSLISYAVGCMFGRYSLDKKGLIHAGGEFDESRYKKFKVDPDNIIPITDETYFDDDIVKRFKKFIEVAFGKETLNENLDFIAETLGKKGTETSEETIRRYFVNDFFNDHCKIYQKRPIYWLLDSGKKNGFKALIYMHRYNENLIPKARLDYLHRVQTTYEKLLSDVNYKLTTDLSMTDKKEAKNRQSDLNAKLNEIKEYDEKIAYIANQRISIDLDDGVKVNYDKFKDILAKIK